jgi:hypothetical protein
MALFGTTWVKSKVIKDLQEPPAHQAYKDLRAQQELQAHPAQLAQAELQEQLEQELQVHRAFKVMQEPLD